MKKKKSFIALQQKPLNKNIERPRRLLKIANFVKNPSIMLNIFY